ncbi:MAG: enoyl-CoA hydratase-related protein, partial [Bilophila wadsworthia]
GFGGTQRLPRLVGRGAASLLLFSGNMIDAAEALRIGLVDKIVPHDALAAEVSALAEGIARQARCAVQQTKRCIRHGLESGLESGLSYEAQAFGLCFSTKEQKDRMRAFVNRRR